MTQDNTNSGAGCGYLGMMYFVGTASSALLTAIVLALATLTGGMESPPVAEGVAIGALVGALMGFFHSAYVLLFVRYRPPLNPTGILLYAMVCLLAVICSGLVFLLLAALGTARNAFTDLIMVIVYVGLLYGLSRGIKRLDAQIVYDQQTPIN